MIPYYRDFLKYDTLLQGLNIIPLLQGLNKIPYYRD